MVGEGRGRLPGPAGELARRHGLGTTDLVDERELLGRHTPCSELALEQAPGEERRDAEALEDRLVGHVPIIGGAVVCERCVRFATSSPTSSPTGRSRATSSPSSPTRATSTSSRCRSWRSSSASPRSVFVLPPREGGTVRIRIFTPRNEIPFAGHPCLGTAFVLGAPLQLGVIALETGNGIVPVELERDESGRIVFGRMTQPVPTVEPYDRADEMLAALGVAASELPVEVYDNGVRHAYVVLPVEGGRRRAQAGHERCSPSSTSSVRSRVRGSGTSWKARMFSPLDGVGEDAATGSAAGPLACHLGRHGVVPWGEEIEIEQGTEIGRPSTLYARAAGSGETIESVEVGGSAVTVARGEFRLP